MRGDVCDEGRVDEVEEIYCGLELPRLFVEGLRGVHVIVQGRAGGVHGGGMDGSTVDCDLGSTLHCGLETSPSCFVSFVLALQALYVSLCSLSSSIYTTFIHSSPSRFRFPTDLHFL